MALKLKSWKPFERWLKQEVDTVFGIEQVFELPAFSNLFAYLPSLNQEERERAEELMTKFFKMVYAWNEDDLKMNFIGPLLGIVDFQHLKYRTFFNCQLKTTLKNQPISGRVDCVLAKGYQIPENPMFFLQEYKPETQKNADPLGQLLIAMLAAQALNHPPMQVIYGCYIIGRNWFFVVLDSDKYMVSSSLDATQEDDLTTIIGILKKIKASFEALIGFSGD